MRIHVGHSLGLPGHRRSPRGSDTRTLDHVADRRRARLRTLRRTLRAVAKPRRAEPFHGCTAARRLLDRARDRRSVLAANDTAHDPRRHEPLNDRRAPSPGGLRVPAIRHRSAVGGRDGRSRRTSRGSDRRSQLALLRRPVHYAEIVSSGALRGDLLSHPELLARADVALTGLRRLAHSLSYFNSRR